MAAGWKSISFTTPPALALIVLALTLVFGGFDVRSPLGREAYFTEIRDRLDEIPYGVGTWVGTDLPASTYAIDLLQPNRMIQRRYFDPTTQRVFHLLIVHCKDVRRMEGHFPPVCYPGRGWVSRETDLLALGEGGHGADIDATRYRFTQPDGTFERHLEVISFFVLPAEDPIANDMEELYEAAGSARRAGLGVCQVQFCFYGDGSDPVERTEIANRFLESIRPALDRIADGVPAS